MKLCTCDLHDDLDEVLLPELLLGARDEVVAHLDHAQGGQVLGREQMRLPVADNTCRLRLTYLALQAM